MRIPIVFYSAYGHIYRMAEAVAEGIRDVKGAGFENGSGNAPAKRS